MPDTFDTAITLLNSADEEKRLEGILLLGTIKEARAARELIAFLKEIKQFRYNRIPLWRWLRPFHYPPIIEDLKCWKFSLLEEAAQALVRIGRPAVYPLLIAVGEAGIFGKIDDEIFIWALGEIGDLDALPLLDYLAAHSPQAYPIDVAAKAAVAKIKSANADILDKPIPAAEPQPSVENLPRPAQPPELPTEDLPRPSDGLFTDGTDRTD